MNCWTAEHYDYVVMASLSVAMYLPIAVYSRPLWQQAKTGLNIMNRPKFLLVKTCIQVLLVSVGKSLSGPFTEVHGVVFSFLMAVFIWMTWRIQPFNYGRFNVWEIASLIAILYISLMAVFSFIGEEEHIGWFIGLIVGWAIIFGGAYLIQRKFFPNLLVPPGGRTNRKRDIKGMHSKVNPLSVVSSDELVNDFGIDSASPKAAAAPNALPSYQGSDPGSKD
jgi:hypothetical protein